MFSYNNDVQPVHIPKIAYVGVQVPLTVLADSVDADRIVELALQTPEPWFTVVGYGCGSENAEKIIVRGTCDNVLGELDPFVHPSVAKQLRSLSFSLTLGAVTKAIAHYAYNCDVEILTVPAGGMVHGMHSLVKTDDITPYMASAILEIAVYGDIVHTK